MRRDSERGQSIAQDAISIRLLVVVTKYETEKTAISSRGELSPLSEHAEQP